MGDLGDVSWVQRVLSGEAPCGSSSQPRDHPRTKQRAARNRRDAKPSADASGASAAGSHRDPRRDGEPCGRSGEKATRSQASHDDVCASSSASVPAQAAAAAAAQQRPDRSRTDGNAGSSPAGGLNSYGKNKCQLCKCWLWGGDLAWQTHISGIAHRQQVHSR